MTMAVMAAARKIILASSSPRRQELIRSLGLDHEIIVSSVDESTEPGLAPSYIAESLSVRKARAVYEQYKMSGSSNIVIGSDTIVVYRGEVLGKPVNEEDSYRMLKLLQGDVHQVYSGIACIDAASGRTLQAHKVTSVRMKPLTDEQIWRYIATGEPRDKAGSYAIQGFGATIVDAIEGDYFNVVGLSVSLLADLLSEFGVAVF